MNIDTQHNTADALSFLFSEESGIVIEVLPAFLSTVLTSYKDANVPVQQIGTRNAQYGPDASVYWRHNRSGRCISLKKCTNNANPFSYHRLPAECLTS